MIEIFCTKCQLYKSSKINNIDGWGDLASKILILGESPGEQEERDGIPFVGDAGKKLWEILAKFGVTRDQCRIVNVLGCRPNKKDKSLDLLSCIPLCRENFLKKIGGCNPDIVITLGDPALFAVTGETKISKHRGLHTWDQFPNAKVVSTYHPAYLLYSHNPTAQSDVMEDLSLVFGKKAETAHYYVLGPGEDLTTLLKEVESKGSYSLDIETTSLDWMSARILCGAVCLEPYTSYTIPLLGRYAADIWTQDDFNMVVKFFQRLLSIEASVCGDNIKFDFKCLKFYGAELNPKSFIWSNDLAHHLIREEDPHSLDYLTSQYTDMPLYKDNFLKLVAQNSKRGKKDFSAPPEKDLWIYNAKDADAQLRVARALYPLVKAEGLLELYGTFTEPLIHQTMEWEIHGVLIDVPLMTQVKTQLQGENTVLANEIRTEVSLPELNIGSDQQVADLLFNQIGLESLKKTKGKKNSVSDKEVLIKYDDIPLVHNIRNYRKRKTLISLVGGSAKGIPRFLDKNSRVHPEAKIGRAKTGRVTYGKPTLQNIPDTKSMRGMIKAPEGYSILSGDYCLEEDTLIQVPGGDVPIKDIRPGDLVISWNKLHCLSKVLAVRDMGLQPCYYVGLDNERSFIASEDHKMQLKYCGGMVDPDTRLIRVKDLVVGDSLHPSNRSVFEGREHYGRTSINTMVRNYYGVKVVHHKDDNPLNNNPSNWELGWSSSQHNSYHAARQNGSQWGGKAGKHRSYEGCGNPNYGKHEHSHIEQCLTCGEQFRVPNSQGIKDSGYCSSKCYHSSRKKDNHKVVSKVFVGLRRCFDIEVENTHRFCLSAGVVSHNCQIELYIAALMSHDDAMLAAVRDDLHNYVAINVLHSPTHIDEGTRKVMADPLFRKKAKTLNFGVCLPMSDEMLTRGGWKKYGEVYIGDVILGYNMLSGRNEWTTVEDIIYNESTPMVEFGNANTKLKCSIGHRWVDNHRHTGLPKRLGAYSRYYLKKLSAVEDIDVESNLILASHSDGGNSDVTENEAAIIAWLMTDGSIKGNSNTIWQKKDNFCRHIEWLLDQEDALASIYVMSSGVLGYHLTSSYSKYLWNKSGLNNVTLDQFILSLNEKSRGAFLLNAYYAEGTVCKKNKSRVITQNAGELLDAIKLAAFLEGYFVSQHRNPNNRYPLSTGQKIILSDPILTGQKIKLRTCGLEPSWCVRTGLGTVIARSDKYMFITGNCYGETEWGLSKSMPCSKDEAIEYIAGFYRRFPMWKRFTEEIANQVYTRNYVEDIYGRRRHIHLTPEMSPMQRAALLREAVNQPIQGTATDILHFAAMRVHKRFKEEFGRGLATVLFTHHDAIVCEVRNDVLDRAKYIMLEEMLRPIPQLGNFVPVVDPVTGPCWFSKNDDAFALEEAEVLDAEEDEEDEDNTTGEEVGNEQSGGDNEVSEVSS